MDRGLVRTALLIGLLAAPAAADFSGTIAFASADAPPQVSVGSLVMLVETPPGPFVWLGGQAYPVWFLAKYGPLETWWYALPGRLDARRGWISVNDSGWFSGVYGPNYPDLYWKFEGPTDSGASTPEPATAAMFALAAGLMARRRRA